jgi:hypothetical protein
LTIFVLVLFSLLICFAVLLRTCKCIIDKEREKDGGRKIGRRTLRKRVKVRERERERSTHMYS